MSPGGCLLGRGETADVNLEPLEQGWGLRSENGRAQGIIKRLEGGEER